MSELVSVIVPVYNVKDYLPRCLRAISEQTYRNLEIILVDDGSTDGSAALCEAFAVQDARAHVIHQPNQGLWAARNAGQDAAHGAYFFFPDGDDYFHRDIIRILLDAINDGDGYDLAMCRIKLTDNDYEDAAHPEKVTLTEVDLEALFRNLFREGQEDPFAVFMWNKLFRGDIIRDIRTNPYARSQDKDYMIRLFPMIEKAILVENRLYYWRQHRSSLTHSGNNLPLYHECRTKMCFRNYLTIPENARPFEHYLLDEFYVRMLFWREASWNTPSRQVVVKECRKMVKQTRKKYLYCQIIPLRKRLACLTLAHCPRLTHTLMHITNNS